MIRSLAALIFGLIVLFGAGPSHADWSLADMNKTIDQTNFLVNDNCSGTLVSTADRYVLTANHCIEDQYETVEVEHIDADGVVSKNMVRRIKDGTVSQLAFDGAENVKTTTYKFKVVAVSAEFDLALLQIKSTIPNTVEARLSCADPVRGEKVYVVGNPKGTLYSSVTYGVVSSVQRDYARIHFETKDPSKPLIQISGSVIGGNSGGAAYDDAGKFIGVPVLASAVNETLAFAVPVASVKQFLADKNLADVYGYCDEK